MQLWLCTGAGKEVNVEWHESWVFKKGFSKWKMENICYIFLNKFTTSFRVMKKSDWSVKKSKIKIWLQIMT